MKLNRVDAAAVHWGWPRPGDSACGTGTNISRTALPVTCQTLAAWHWEAVREQFSLLGGALLAPLTKVVQWLARKLPG
jgi:hypothetical protein